MREKQLQHQEILHSSIHLHKKEIKSNMKFGGGTLSLILTATAVAASTFNNVPVAKSRILQKRTLFGVGMTSNIQFRNPIEFPRGGAFDDEDEEADIRKVLYLPGLLGASVLKKAVSS